MRKILLGCLGAALILGSSGCYRCYTCTAETADGPLEREVCGRKKDIANLILELENDNVGVGPWVCQ